jgi:phosphate transport system substrate-binding protein
MLSRLIAIGAAVIMTTGAYAAEITGAGASFPYPIYLKWSSEYSNATGKQVNYQSIGSGAGIKQIEANVVTFGATDMPLKPEDLEKNNLVQFPTVVGGVVPVVNLDNVAAGQLVLDGDTLAKIYLGQIKKWDDAAIRALNPHATLPNLPIVVVRRADGSGTTFVFTHYLSQVNADWKNSVGEGTAIEFPVGIGAKGNDGVSSNVQQTKGAIGYVEYAYAKQNNLTFTGMVNADKKSVKPEIKTFMAAAAGADWNSVPGFGIILTNTAGADSWPITSATFILMQKAPADKAASKEAINFFDFAYAHGDFSAESLDYVPLPAPVKKAVVESWKKIQNN